MALAPPPETQLVNEHQAAHELDPIFLNTELA